MPAPRAKSNLLLTLATCLLLTINSNAGAACRHIDFMVGIDIGHTVQHGGAVSSRGIPEYQFNARMARLLESKLEAAGFSNVVLINQDGNMDNIESRTQKANEIPVDLLLSIHHDSVQPRYLSTWSYNNQELTYSDRFRGFSIFISRKQKPADKSLTFSLHLGNALLEADFTPSLHHEEPIPGESRLLLDRSRGIYANDYLAILRKAKVPAVLLECGVIKHRDEESDLNDPVYRERMAEAIVSAVKTFCAAET